MIIMETNLPTYTKGNTWIEALAHIQVNEVNKLTHECQSTNATSISRRNKVPAFDNMTLSIVKSDDTSRFLITHLTLVTI